MFDLERREKFIIIFLLSTLLLGLGVALHEKWRGPIKIEIEDFKLEEEISEESYERININEADLEELARLKGVGKVLAERIIDYRNKRGPFASASEIKNVRGVGQSLFEKIKDDIAVE